MLPIFSGRRTQVVKGEVCKTSMQRFESARRLQIPTIAWFMDAFGWINLVLLIIVLIGYSHHKGTYHPFKAPLG